MNNDESSKPPSLFKRLLVGAVGTVLLGAVGSGVWQLVFSPGVDWVTQILSTVSHRINDASYASAALDPRPVSSLIILLFLTQLPLWLAMLYLIMLFLKPLAAFFLRERKPAERRKWMSRRLRGLAITGVILSIGLYLVAQVGFSSTNQAVLIWRVFHTNLARCAPYLSDEERRMLESRFRSMEREEDYLKIEGDLNSVAVKKGLRLKTIRD